MTAHNPITAARAVTMVEAVGAVDARRLIADHAAAGLVKSYALVIETTEDGAGHSSVRGAGIPTELWRRIIQEGVAADVWPGSTVRLAAGELIGGPPAVSITGIEFEQMGIARLVEQVRGKPRGAAARASVALETVSEPGTDRSPRARSRKTNVDAIPAGAMLATINQTMAALGLGRTKVNELMKAGSLERVDIDGAVRITTKSVKAVLGISN